LVDERVIMEREHADLLIANNHEIGSYTTDVAR
jgi:hypothetical protein